MRRVPLPEPPGEPPNVPRHRLLVLKPGVPTQGSVPENPEGLFPHPQIRALNIFHFSHY